MFPTLCITPLIMKSILRLFTLRKLFAITTGPLNSFHFLIHLKLLKK